MRPGFGLNHKYGRSPLLAGFDCSTLMAKDSIRSTKDASPHPEEYLEKGEPYLPSDQLDSVIDSAAEKRLLRKLDYTLLPLFTLLCE